MFSMIKHCFSSSEMLLKMMSRSDIEEAKEKGERILIDEDGGASVNLCSSEVQADFARHVATLSEIVTGTNRQ
ncbi:hypothetical protein [Erwinia sp.]|uniref:hypothetical protein n=1 Tax=Erwinia citreus TaxID=558 RepID=UPI003C72033E